MIDLIHNLALLVALSVASGAVRRRVGARGVGALLQGGIFGGAAVICMVAPQQFAPVFHFDSRTVAVSIAALYFGPVAGLVSGTMAGICRLFLGGEGMATELLVIAMAGFAGGVFRTFRPMPEQPMTALRLWSMGVIVHAVMLGAVFAAAGSQASGALREAALPVLLFFPIATVLVGKILNDQQVRRDFVERLSEANEQMASILHSIRDGVISTDAALRIQSMNPAAARLTGWPAAAARGRPLTEVLSLVDELTRESVEDAASRTLREGRETKSFTDAVLVGRDGREFLVENAAAPIYGDEGAIAGTVAVLRDHTEERAAERAAENSRKRFERALEHVPDVVVIYDTDLRIQYINEATRRVTGQPSEFFIGKREEEIFPPEVYEPFMPALHAALEKRETSSVEVNIELPGTGMKSLYISCVPIMDDKGHVIEVLGITRDLTERKKSIAALQAREALLRIAGRAARLGGWTVDFPSGAITWSDEVYAIHEVPTDFEPALPDVLQFFPNEWQDVVMEAFEACAGSGTPYDIEVELVTARGRRIWVRSIGEALRDESGSVVRVQGALQDISRIKSYENSIEQSHVRFRQLADAMPLIVWTANPDGAIDYTSMEFEHFSGQPGSVANERGWLDVVHPDDAEQAWAVWAEAYPAGGPYVNEFRLRRKDGVYRWHHIQGVPIRDKDGTIVKWYGTATDIHDLKENEAKLRGMANRLTATLESITDAFCTLDREWRYTYVNPEAERLARVPKAEMLGRVYSDVFPELKGSELETNLQRAVQENRACSFTTRFQPLGLWLEIRAYPSEEGMTMYYRDITEQIEAERELREVTNRLEGILDFSPLLISVFNLEGRYLVANSASCAFYGMAPDELTGQNFNELLPKDIAEILSNAVREVARSGKSHTREIDVALEGETRTFSAVFFPLKDSAGNTISVGGIANDITETKAAEAERARLVEQLHHAQKMDAVGRLAGGVAHDFNNMLGVILGYSEMALGNMEEGAPLEPELREIQTAAMRSAELTRQLLAFARKQTIAPQVLDLNGVVESMLRILGRLIGENVELVWKPGNNLSRVRVDPTQVDQIIANLAVNARDAIDGIGRLSIQTAEFSADEAYCAQHTGAAPGNFVMVAVSDNGCGMDSETIEQVFEPFFTTKPQGQGTGLGLATVYGIVKQNDGFIEVESTPGAGSTFKVFFPQCADAGAKIAADIVRPALPRGTETVLLVEDEAALLALGTRQLELLGYAVLPATSPLEALATARDHPGEIDLLLTDVIMPEMDGRELWRRLMEIRPSVKTLFMSGYTADTIARGGVLEEGVNFLQKPFKTEHIAEKVREAIDEKSSG